VTLERRIMKKIIGIVFLVLLLASCAAHQYPPHQPKEYTFKKLVLPQDPEGKKCAVECKKIQLMEDQLSEAKTAPRDRYTVYDMRSIDQTINKGNYESCVTGCGGTYETRTETW